MRHAVCKPRDLLFGSDKSVGRIKKMLQIFRRKYSLLLATNSLPMFVRDTRSGLSKLSFGEIRTSMHVPVDDKDEP
jgi:hypothetical protein